MGEANRDGLDLANPWFSATDVTLAYDGRAYAYRYLPGEYRRKRYGGERQVKPPGVQLSVTLPRGFGGSVVIVPEDGWDRVCRAVGLCPEFQTGVPDVDVEFMLSGVVGEDLGRALRSPATHQGLRALFNAGFTRIELFDDRITAVCRPWLTSIPTNEPPSEIRQAVSALGQLQDLLASVPASPSALTARWHHRISSPAPAAYVIASLVAALALFLMLQMASFLSAGDVRSALGGPAFGAGLAAAAVAAGVMRRQAFRGRTIAAVLLLVGTVACLGALDVLAAMNQALDASPPTSHVVPIHSKSKGSGRSPSYRIRTASWRSDHGSESFELSSGIWTQVVPGHNTFVVATHPGYFGVEWIANKGVR